LISVIIPTLNEEGRLPACLDAVSPQARQTGAEVLVVDGGSTDRTRRVAVDRRGVRWVDAARGRGRQMNAGARAARGSTLLFVPADTLLPSGALAALAKLDDAEEPAAGGYRQRFDTDRLALRLVSALHNLRARWTGVFYGDQAPFVRTALFRELGGYREEIDMEDVEFGARIRKRARWRQIPLTVTTSARRFDRSGDLRATATAAVLLASWVFLRRVPRSRTFFDPVR